MVDAAPFAAVRYDPRVAGDPATTSAPSYDDVEPHTYARHRTVSPYTVLELLAGRAGEQGYAAAGAALARWRRTGVLVRDPVPAYYLYEEHELRGGVPAVQRGLLAAVALEPLDGAGAVLPHEEVDPDRVEGRVDRLEAAPVDVSPVFALYRGEDEALRALLAGPPRRPPVVAVTDDEGVDHRVWALTDPADLAVVRAGLAGIRAVIADGHHRYAAAVAFAERRRAGGAGAADPAWTRTLMYLVDVSAHGPRVQPIHRLLEGVATLEPLDALFDRREGPAEPEALARAVAARGDGTIGLWTADGGVLLHPRDTDRLDDALPANRPSAWRGLGTAVLDHVALPALQPARVTPRTDVAAAAATASAPGGALLLLAPVSAELVIDLATAGAPMPAKTTSFVPKPRTGLLLRDVVEPGHPPLL